MMSDELARFSLIPKQAQYVHGKEEEVGVCTSNCSSMGDSDATV